MYRTVIFIFVALATTLIHSGVAAFDTSRIEDAAVRDCADRSLPSRTAAQMQKVTVTGKNGFVRESLREVMWKRSENNDSRVLLRMLEPIEDKGVSVLVLDDAERSVVSYQAYSPKIKRVRRINGDAFFGTILRSDFSYDDFRYFYSVDEREEVMRIDDAILDDAPAYVLETTKPDENGRYSKVRFYIDQELCVPVRTEFFALNGSLRKELTADREEIRQIGERWIPHRVVMTDLEVGSSSEYVATEVQIDPDIDDGVFEVQSLKRGGH